MSNLDIEHEARRLKIPGFWGVFMRDALPASPQEGERAVLNLDRSEGQGTHWVAWATAPEGLRYFDSFGLPPPAELVTYWRRRWGANVKPLIYNTTKIQRRFDPPVCGHLCLEFLRRAGSEPFGDLMLALRRERDA